MIAELTLRAIETNTIEGSSARSLDATPDPGEAEEAAQDTRKWERVVRDTLAAGRVGNLNVDPEFLVLQPQSRKWDTPYDLTCFQTFLWTTYAGPKNKQCLNCFHKGPNGN